MRKDESSISKQEKELSKIHEFKIFAMLSFLFGLLYAICFYKAGKGISIIIFTILNNILILIWIKKLKIKYKKETWFYMGSTILLAISVFLSSNVYMRVFTKIGILVLYFCYMLYQMHDDTSWGFIKYILAIIKTINKTITKLHLPVKDFIDSNKGDRQRNIKNITIGITISIPMLILVLILLSNADIIFYNFLSFNKTKRISEVVHFIIMVLIAYFIGYAFMNAVEKEDIEPNSSNMKKSDAMIAITFTSILSVVYFLFSMIQVFALFLGKMNLPEGYTYAEYAREGFFQLLVICVLNMILVIFCLKKYKITNVLKITLTIILICTFIILASSGFRMGMYVKEYNLTFLRILVFWSLFVILFLMIGVMIRIYRENIQTFRYSMVIVTICYMILAFMKPDFIIAKYNLTKMVTRAESTENAIYYYQDMDYVYSLSADIVPALRDFVEDGEYAIFSESDEVYVLKDLKNYLNKIENEVDFEDIRDFHIGEYIAMKDITFCKEKLSW